MPRSRFSGGVRVASWPSIRMRPDVGVAYPASMRSVVVLPQPLGPSSVVRRPRGMRRSIESTAVKLPNRWETPTSSAAGVVIG